MRYEGNLYKGIFWYWFARYIRRRDAILFGTCISCGSFKSFEELQAGHFAPAGSCGMALIFDEANVNGECGRCNAFDGAHLWGYARNLDKRYGKGTAEKLQARYDKRHQIITKEWSQTKYIQEIDKYRDLYDKLTDL